MTIGTEVLASSRVRVYQYLPFLEDAGIRCFVMSMVRKPAVAGMKPSFWKGIRILMGRIVKYLKIGYYCLVCDVVLIQKVLFPVWRQNLIRLLNRNLVFDFDDAIYLSGPLEALHRKGVREERVCHLLRICRCVIVCCEHLRSYSRPHNQNILMITGPVDCERYVPRKQREENGKLIIGWIGTPNTTPYLEPLIKVFAEIERNYPQVAIELIGASPLKGICQAVKIVEWSFAGELDHLHRFDIGIMPLWDNEQSRGKGGYKLLQYMAIGIPCVASPVGINSSLIQEGVNGYLADSEEQWYEKLARLIENQALREAMGARGREIAERDYSLRVSAPKMAEYLKRIG